MLSIPGPEVPRGESATPACAAASQLPLDRASRMQLPLNLTHRDSCRPPARTSPARSELTRHSAISPSFPHTFVLRSNLSDGSIAAIQRTIDITSLLTR